MEGAGGPGAGGGGGGSVALTGARAWLFIAEDTPMGPSMASLKRKFDQRHDSRTRRTCQPFPPAKDRTMFATPPDSENNADSFFARDLFGA